MGAVAQHEVRWHEANGNSHLRQSHRDRRYNRFNTEQDSEGKDVAAFSGVDR